MEGEPRTTFLSQNTNKSDWTYEGDEGDLFYIYFGNEEGPIGEDLEDDVVSIGRFLKGSILPQLKHKERL